MPVLENGDVIHHFLEPEFTARASDGGFMDETKLLRGEVKAVIYPEDKLSRGKRTIEYIVYAQRRSNNTDLTQEFRCVLSNVFGGVADKFRATMRMDNTDNKNKEAIGNGSKVLFLCINGEKHRGIILGAVKDNKDEPDKDMDKLGHHLLFVFNGINVTIDKDGQLQLQYLGKTDNDGKTDVDSSVAGSLVLFDKDGNIGIGDKDGKNKFFIDHKNSKVTIARDSAFELGDATDKMLLGSSFRDAHKTMHDTMKNLYTAVQTLIQTAGTQLTTGVPLNAVPIVGGALAAGNFAAAAAALVAAAPLLNQLGQAIDTFEQQGSGKNSFLSKKNSSD